MEGCTDIVVDEQFVIHVVDNRQPAAQCSQSLTSLPEAFRGVLKTYLLSLLKPRFRRKHYGTFQPDAPVLAEYQRIVESAKRLGRVEESVLLDASQRLARSLFAAMQQGGQSQNGQNGSAPRLGGITPGDLLVGLFYAKAPEVSSVPYLFVIKADLETALQRQIETRSSGEIHTVLTRQEGLLPKLSAAHVQKSALIRWTDDPSTYDVVMTDPQGGKQGIAKFFCDDFLRTEPFYTADKQAELLFRRTHAWMADHEAELSPQERSEVIETVRTLIEDRSAQAEPVTPRQLIEILPLSEERERVAVAALQESFQVALTVSDIEAERIPLDRELIVQDVPAPVAKTRVTYQLDHGVQLSGDSAALAELFLHPPQRVNGKTEFTIRTSTFRPLL